MTLRTIDVFLSHSSKDKEIVSYIASSLAKSGIRSWLDEIELRKFGGLDLFQTIKESIQKGEKPCMLLFISSHSCKSKWVDREIKWLLGSKSKNFRIIPILLKKYKELDLSKNMKKLLENIKGERTLYYFEHRTGNHYDLMNFITFSIYNHYSLDDEEEVVIHAGHRLPWDSNQVPDVWVKFYVLDFRTKLENNNSYFVPATEELSEIEEGMKRARKALAKLKRINFCGATYLSFTGLLSKTWGRGSGIDLVCWNMIESKVLDSSFDVITEEPKKYLFELIEVTREESKNQRNFLTIFIGWQENIAKQVIEEYQQLTSLLWLKTSDQWKINLRTFISQIVYFITKIASEYEEINIIFGLPLELVAAICWNLRAIRKINLYEYKRKGKEKYIKTVELM